MKYTRGEWKVMPGITQPRICVEGDKEWPIVLVVSGDSEESIVGNQNLIAAAPDMFEALEIIHHEVMTLQNPFSFGHKVLINQALKKARGTE